MIRHPYTTGGLVRDRFEGKNFTEVIWEEAGIPRRKGEWICHTLT